MSGDLTDSLIAALGQGVELDKATDALISDIVENARANGVSDQTIADAVAKFKETLEQSLASGNAPQLAIEYATAMLEGLIEAGNIELTDGQRVMNALAASDSGEGSKRSDRTLTGNQHPLSQYAAGAIESMQSAR